MSLHPPQTYRKAEGLHRSGLASGRPAASDVLVGTLYFSTDKGVLERSDGQAWSTFTGRTGLFNYTYNDSLVEPPAAGQARLNAAFPWATATKLWMRFVSADDQDLYWGIMIITVGATLLLQDRDEHTKYLRMITTAVPVDKGLYAEIPIQWVSNGASISTAQQIFFRVSGAVATVSPSVTDRLDQLEARVLALETPHGE